MTFFELIGAQCDLRVLAGRDVGDVAELTVSVSVFPLWRRRATDQSLSARGQRRADLLVLIAAVNRDSAGTYGASHVTAELSAQGQSATEKTVAKIMAGHGIAGISPCSFKVVTTIVDRSALTLPGDARGTSSGVVAAYFKVITSQRVVGCGRRAHVATRIGWGGDHLCGLARGCQCGAGDPAIR